MKALHTFWNEIRASSSHPVEHAALVRKPLKSALRYLYWFLFCAGCISALQIAVIGGMFIPKIAPFIVHRAEELRTMYPKDLVVTLKEGQVSTNAEEPVIIDGPETWKEILTESGSTKHVLVIDTSATAEDFKRYNTYILVTKNSIVAQDNNGTRVVPLDQQDRVDQEEIVIDQKFVMELITGLEGILRYVPRIAATTLAMVVLFYPFAAAGLRWLWLLVYLFPMTLVMWAFSAATGKSYTYGQLYRLGIFGLTLPVLYSLVARFLPALYLPFTFTLIFIVWMGIVISAKAVKTKYKAAH